MELHEISQGSEEWHQLRARHYCASDAAAMLGISKYKTRDEYLREKATGISREHDAATEERFARGRQAEDAARPIVESILGEDLYPVVGTDVIDGLPLLASFDGLTMLGDIPWENKLPNNGLLADLERGEIGDTYWPQLEQQLLLSGAEQIYFTASDGTPEGTKGIWYESQPERRKRLLQGWKQFAVDLEHYEHQAAPEKVTAAPIKDLPAPAIKVDGKLALISNLDVFGDHLKQFIAGINRQPDDDQGFADAEAAITVLEKAEAALKAAKANGLAQTTTIDEMCRTVDLYHETARQVRLELQKMVKARKEQLKAEAISNARIQINSHLQALNEGLGGNYLNDHVADFPGVIRGKKTLASVRSSLNDEVARAKIEASERAEKIRANLKTLDAHPEHRFLFNDLNQIVHKAPEDFAALVKLRVQEHEHREEQRREQERQRIREEEERKARAKVETEAKEREEAERKVKEEASRQAQPSPSLQEVLDAAAPAEVANAFRTEPELQKTIEQHKANASFQGMGARASTTRPTDADIIGVLALNYRVHESKVISWLLGMDLQAASESLRKAI